MAKNRPNWASIGSQSIKLADWGANPVVRDVCRVYEANSVLTTAFAAYWTPITRQLSRSESVPKRFLDPSQSSLCGGVQKLLGSLSETPPAGCSFLKNRWAVRFARQRDFLLPKTQGGGTSFTGAQSDLQPDNEGKNFWPSEHPVWGLTTGFCAGKGFSIQFSAGRGSRKLKNRPPNRSIGVNFWGRFQF